MITGIEQITDSRLLNSDNSTLFLSEKGLLYITLDGNTHRAFLALAFPFITHEEFISVLNEEKDELGMIRSLSVFDQKTQEILRSEIEKKYFAPKILKIKKLLERNGSSFWECETNFGPLSFTVKDTHRSLIRVGDNRIFVADHDGCRYEIPNVLELDKKSYSKIELYL